MKESTHMNASTSENIESPSTPAVSEKDFPSGSTRLQELMKTFRGNQQTYQQMPVQTSNPLANVKVVSELSDKKFDDLSLEHQQKVLARIAGVDYTVSSQIQNFGSTKESPMTKHAEVIISKYSANEFNDLASPMTDLVASLKSNDPSSIVSIVKPDKDPSKPMGIIPSIRKISSMKKAKKKMFKMIAERDSIKKNLDTISVELKKEQVSLQKDIQVYENMTGVAFEQIYEFELDCIALDLMIEEAQEKLRAIVSKGEIDQMEAATAKNLNAAINRMIRRKSAIKSVQTSAIQNIPMIGGIILGDEIVCEKIDEVHSLVIPMWTWQYAIAIGHLKQQEALSIQKTIRGITSRLLTGNAKMLHDNIIAAQEELYSAAVAIEDLMEVQKYIDDMVTTVQSKSKEALQNCVNGMKTMKEIEQKNYDLLSQSLTTDTTLPKLDT